MKLTSHPTVVVVISLLVSGSQSISFLNNVSVSSDVLSELFVNEVESSKDQVYIFGGAESNEYNSQKCLLSLREIVKRFPSRDVAPFFDAWGSLPSGILSANQYDIGNFDQCVKLSVTFNQTNDVATGQFCFATLPLKEPPRGIGGWVTPSMVNVGMCVPHTCSPELLTAMFKQSTSDLYDGALSAIYVHRCTDGKVPQLDTGGTVCLIIILIFTALMVASSIYEFLIMYFEKKPVQILLAFSALTNGKRLFAINTKKSRNSIDCFNGLRIIWALWIIHSHTFIESKSAPIINLPDFFAYIYSLPYLATGSNLAVDSFFFMGGLLVAWIGFRDLDRTGGKINVVMNIVHRYIRLTPVMAAGLMFAYSVHKIVYTGPFREQYISQNNCNNQNVWPVLLYIQNYYTQGSDNCYEETWYMAVDFQLHALSPLILIPMWKWGWKFAPVLLVLALASVAYVMGIYFFNEYTGLLFVMSSNYWKEVYVPTHARCAPWIVGFVLGYFIYRNRQTTFHISKMAQATAWIACFFIMTAIVFGPYFSLNAYGTGSSTVFEAAMYESLTRVTWAIAHAWITFACYYGYGGIVDAVLSHPILQPFGRMTYAWYMMHVAIVKMIYGMMRTEICFSIYNLFLKFLSAFGITLFVSIYVILAFESPILALEKLIFNKRKPVPNKSSDQTSAQTNNLKKAFYEL